MLEKAGALYSSIDLSAMALSEGDAAGYL